MKNRTIVKTTITAEQKEKLKAFFDEMNPEPGKPGTVLNITPLAELDAMYHYNGTWYNVVAIDFNVQENTYELSLSDDKITVYGFNGNNS